MIAAISSRFVAPSGASAADQANAARHSNAYLSQMAARNTCPQGTQEQFEIAQKYLERRMAQDVEGVLRLMSPSIRAYSQRDGVNTGLKEVENYLRTVTPEGQWGKPYLHAELKMVAFNGRVKYAKLIPINVMGVMRFGQDGRIVEMFVGKA